MATKNRPARQEIPDSALAAITIGTVGVIAYAVYAWGSTPAQPPPPRQTLPLDIRTAASRRAIVRIMQAQLNALGFNAGPVDGGVGPNTETAIGNFLRAHPLARIAGESDDAWNVRVATAIDAAIGARG